MEHSQWGTPVVPIIKPDGSVRLCGDYKLTLNPYLEVDHFPLPHIDDILHILSHGEYFCELDLKEAYLQAPLSEESQDYTTIVTEVGTYKYKYLPYGVSTGPGSFQRLMSKKLYDIPNTVVFIDNIYIAGKNLKDTKDTLCLVLKRFQESEFKLKVEKCKFFTRHINVFGYRVDSEGVRVNKSNVEPLLKTQAPTNLTMLKSFLGKVNLQNMAEVLAPLYECTKQNKFNWTAQCERAFKSIKERLSTVSSLRNFDATLPLVLTCDASNIGIGAVLSNRDEQGTVRPIAYASRKLTNAEQKYSAIDKEALAIIFGITKFYNYTYGRRFELETDNAALVHIFGPTKGIPKMAAKRLQHYAIFLSAFNYIIRHVKTTDNPADYLSRCPAEQVEPDEQPHSLCINCNVTNLLHIDSSKMTTLNWKLIQEETKKD